MKIIVRCPAKINLHLEVLGVRADGYRELRTLFAAVGLWDTLTLVRAEPGVVKLAVDPPGCVPTDGSNLVVKAALALSEIVQPADGVHMHLAKRIPIAGGMGGGSADAAATLVGLAALWQAELPPARVRALAAGLGADVPFFLMGGAAWGVGRGSEVYPLPDLPPWWVVLVAGREPVPTAEVYRSLPASALDGRLESDVYEWVVTGGELPLAACRNDLQPTVLTRWPAIARRLDRLAGTNPRLAMVSGSGGTVFGLFENQPDARRAAAELSDLAPVVAPVLGRSQARLHPSAEED